MQNSLRERQSQLERSREESRVLSETNRDLQQVITMLEDEKRHHNEEVTQLLQEKRTLEEENERLVREKVRCL